MYNVYKRRDILCTCFLNCAFFVASLLNDKTIKFYSLKWALIFNDNLIYTYRQKKKTSLDSYKCGYMRYLLQHKQ